MRLCVRVRPVARFLLRLPLPNVRGRMAANTLSGSSTKEKRPLAAYSLNFYVDAVGNRYPASQKYVATGETQPQKGDVVDYPTDTEKLHFSEGWSVIDGVEVRVTRVMFKDNTVCVPQKVQACKTVFMNDDYDAALEKRWKAVEKKMQEEKQERKH
jgi:hypothetical protein